MKCPARQQESATPFSKDLVAARNLPVLKPASKAWEAAVNQLSKLKVRAADFRTRTATEAKRLLKEARGNMDRRKQYTQENYRKGYEVHNDQNARELGAGNDLQ